MEITQKRGQLKELLELIALNLKVGIKNSIEYLKTIALYYRNRNFAKADLLLLKAYLFQNPFRISRQQLQTMGEEEIYTYGETPLTTMELIAKTCDITKEDTVFEVGSGRGRTCFWLRTIIGCSVVGIEWLSPFVAKARSVAQKIGLDRITFRQEDFIDSSFKGATIVYLYGTCLRDEQIAILARHLDKLPKGTKVITVSYPLTDYTTHYTLLSCFSAPFTWGNTEVYLQVKQ